MNNHTEIINYILEEAYPNETSMAKVIAKIFENKYCVIIENNQYKWFKKVESSWETSKGIIVEIRIKLSDEISPIIAQARSLVRNRLHTLNNDDRNFEETRMKSLTKCEAMLYNTTHKNNIIKELEARLYRDKLP